MQSVHSVSVWKRISLVAVAIQKWLILYPWSSQYDDSTIQHLHKCYKARIYNYNWPNRYRRIVAQRKSIGLINRRQGDQHIPMRICSIFFFVRSVSQQLHDQVNQQNQASLGVAEHQGTGEERWSNVSWCRWPWHIHCSKANGWSPHWQQQERNGSNDQKSDSVRSIQNERLSSSLKSGIDNTIISYTMCLSPI